MTLDFGDINLEDIIKKAAPTIIQSAGTWFGADSQASANSAAANDYAVASQRAADILNAGYDEQLGHLESGADTQRTINEQGYGFTTGQQRAAVDEFGRLLDNSVADYGAYLVPQYDEYGNQVQIASSEFGDAYSPYMETGQNALNYQAQAMGQDPSVLTPAQARAQEKYRRDAIARLASSGLRGAGRAGVAAVNEGDAALAAQFYEQNQNRADRAASELGARGYGATGQVAANRYNAGVDVAKTGMNLAQDIAGKGLAAKQTGASEQLNTGRKVADLTGQYFGNMSTIEANRSGNRGTAAINKAVSNASAVSAGAGKQFDSSVANADLKGQAIGTIATGISNAIRDGGTVPGTSAVNRTKPNTQVPANFDVYKSAFDASY